MPEVKVPQKDGSITIRRGGEEPVTRHVSDHIVKVGDEDLEHFLANVDGSNVVEAKPASSQQKG
jgi:hypothetical protein